MGEGTTAIAGSSVPTLSVRVTFVTTLTATNTATQCLRVREQAAARGESISSFAPIAAALSVSNGKLESVFSGEHHQIEQKNVTNE